jgi:hypothetical protein
MCQGLHMYIKSAIEQEKWMCEVLRYTSVKSCGKQENVFPVEGYKFNF